MQHNVIGPNGTPLTHVLAAHLGADAKVYGESVPIGNPFVVLLMPYRETPNAVEAVQQALLAVEHWGPREAILLSNAGVFNPNSPGLRRETDEPDATDAFGRTLLAAEAAFERHGAHRPIVRLPAPIARVPEAGALLHLLDQGAWPTGALQGFDPATLAGDLEPCAHIRLTHLACGPVPVQTVAAGTGHALQPQPTTWGTGWDRLRTQWSESWGRLDGLAAGRRGTLAALTSLANGTG
jgi:hypothetical protein